MAGCNDNPPTGENPSRWRIEIIKVPLANPAAAAVVGEPRLFTDPVTGAIDGLQNAPPTPLHPSGMNWGPTPITDACHDITSYPAIGLAAAACEGNGILIDISDPANPVRLDEVSDPNFAYWHSATLNNDGTKVIFTDEWGGGTAARCRMTDQPQWGANAIFDIVDGQMQFASYYKLPVPQVNQENCVAHNGSLIPVPGRDIMAQAWYQGGVSLMDFTDSANPTRDRVLRPRSGQHDHRAGPGRLLVGVLVQRPDLRQRDRPRLRRLRPGAEHRADRGRDRGRARGAAAAVQPAAPAADHLGAELRRRAGALRPAGTHLHVHRDRNAQPAARRHRGDLPGRGHRQRPGRGPPGRLVAGDRLHRQRTGGGDVGGGGAPLPQHACGGRSA